MKIKISHLLWIIPLASTFGAMIMAVVGFDRFEDECDIQIVSHDGFESPSGVFNWTIPPDAGIAYIRVTSYTNGDGSKMIVTINEEIEA